MKTPHITVRLRVPEATHNEIQNIAQATTGSVSSVIRDALVPYLHGSKALPVTPPNDRVTTCLVAPEDWARLKELAGEANLSMDEAVRTIVKEHLNSFY